MENAEQFERAIKSEQNTVYNNRYDFIVASYIESCKIYEPEFTKCSTRSIQAFMNQLVKGEISP